jgi:hypothetical protein
MEQPMRQPNSKPTSRRQVFAIAAGAIVGGAADASQAATDIPTDPIFAGIEAHRVAWVARDLVTADAAAMALLDIEPTTIPGAMALLRYGAEAGIIWPGDRVADEFDNANEAFLCVLMGHVADALEGFVKG